ncbi:MAG: anaerobic ribonucleoside-triphosphate reductase activating protein [Holosporales bacterium]|jgi:pyruvate formate lyase activating enzyme|nr:anaerobic ribonucleoside-triphosphate reductase activating protein [Holosporales bacterium]
MKIGGLLKFSTLDYPGKLSAVIFSQGCPLRCVYCHNPDFLDFNLPGNEDFNDVLRFLESRKGLLDAVVFSGGDPLLQTDLKESMLKAKDLGFLIGIHTSGIIPDAFAKILPIVNWVGFDIKTSFENYEKVTQIPRSGEFAKDSFNKLVKSNVNFEIRTTLDPRVISENDLYTIANILSDAKIKTWILQECILRNSAGDEKLSLPSEDVLANISKYIDVQLRKQ